MKHLNGRVCTYLQVILISAYLFTIKADIVIHITHPWAKSDPVRLTTDLLFQCSETNYYPGEKLMKEGNSWYSFAFSSIDKSSTEILKLVSIIPDEYNYFANDSSYSGTEDFPLNMSTIFEDHPEANEVWITVSSSKADPVFSFTPPPGKVIYFFNPWSLGAPRIDIKGLGIIRMRYVADHCGWFNYNYPGPTDSLLIRFINSLDSAVYSANGLSDGDYIDLADQISKRDTIWILGNQEPDNAPGFSDKFPSIRGDCSTISLAVVLRDKAEAHPDFQSEDCNGTKYGMVEKRLGSNGKPVPTDTSCASHIDDWFLPETLTDGYTNERCFNLTLGKNEEGLYQHDTNAFFPLDDFKFLDEDGKIDNPNYSPGYSDPPHNYYFTMELGAEFEYVPGQTFYFRGDDDVWVFIDSQLVVDIGGVHGPVEGKVDLDTLGLIKGQTYQFKLFFAERHCCGSNFKMVTSINLRTTSKFFYEKTIVSDGVLRYNMFQKLTRNNLTCDFGTEIIDTIPGHVDFYIEGPEFNSPQLLSAGTSYGGIIISDDNSSITLDENLITGLTPGDYLIKFFSNGIEEGKIPFTIYQVPKKHRVPNPVVSAAYFADNGFGQVSRAEIYYKNELDYPPDSIELFWPTFSTKRTVYKNDIKIDPLNSRHLTVTISEPFDKEITASPSSGKKLGYSYTTDTSLAEPSEVVPISLSDSVGPLLTDAILLEDTDENSDTLFLIFSETITDTSLIGESLEFLTGGTSRCLTVLSYARKGDSLLVVIKGNDSFTYTENDSLRINPSGPLRDRNNNKAHEHNRPVVIKLRKSAPVVLHACYKDKNADGTVDYAEIVFDRSVAGSDMKMKFLWSDGIQTETIGSSGIKLSDDGKSVTVDLKNAFNKDVSCKTSGNMLLEIQFEEFLSVTMSAVVNDSAAPVIYNASLKLSTLTEGEFIDTLTITFSEDVETMESIEEFKLFSMVFNSSYKFIVKDARRVNSKTCKYYVITNGVEYPKENDSIWLKTGSAVDDHGNIQNSELNRRAILKVDTPPLNLIISAGPNPFSNTVRSEIYTIMIRPQGRTSESADIDAKVFIYDALGNMIAQLKQFKDHTSSSIVKYNWDGKNMKGRLVGDGTYMAVIKVKGGETVRKMVGVKNE